MPSCWLGLREKVNGLCIRVNSGAIGKRGSLGEGAMFGLGCRTFVRADTWVGRSRS